MSEKFKVVTVPEGGLVNWGDHPKDKPPSGLDEDTAQADAKRRNEKAEGLGIETRYAVASLDDAA